MPKSKKYQLLHDRVLARPGADTRVVAHREEALAEVGLYELRMSQRLSQVELAGLLDITQSAVSKLENADDVRLSTIRDYVEALGGQLELSVRFPDRVVPLDIRRRRAG